MSRGRKINPLKQNNRKQIDLEKLQKQRYQNAIKNLPTANSKQLKTYHTEYPEIIGEQIKLLQKKPSIAKKNYCLIISLNEKEYLKMSKDDKTPATVLRYISDYTRDYDVADSVVLHHRSNENLRLHVLKRWHQSVMREKAWEGWKYAIAQKDASDLTMKRAVQFLGGMSSYRKTQKVDPRFETWHYEMLKKIITNEKTSFQTVNKIINTSHSMPRDIWFEIADLINKQTELPEYIREKAMKKYR